MNPLSSTAALHYLAIIPILSMCHRQANRFNRIYFGTIFLATSFSILWHTYPKSAYLFICDHLFACLWFLLDFMWYKLLNKPAIFELNCAVTMLYLISCISTNYIAAHSAWHVLSAAKCIYVSYIIYRFDGKASNITYNLP
jgi:hypothetical protein